MIVAYPRLGEVLAEVGSIVSVLLSVNILIMSLNEVLLDNVIADKIVKIYFPQFKDYQVKKTIF